jgi:tetrahydromethanopterin S-methyltransferase subunit E
MIHVTYAVTSLCGMVIDRSSFKIRVLWHILISAAILESLSMKAKLEL